MKHEQFMQRCLELAEKGLGTVAPNPMVGCVIVRDEKIIGEGYHQKYGEAHAEVNAINSVADKGLLKSSTLYVSLEPCSHFGKTPPCSDLIIQYGIPYVVIGSVDSNPLVKGKGIERLIKAGIDVKTGVLESECRTLNKRFFTFYEMKRPYIILKWAQTADGFIDKKRTSGDGQLPLQISGDASKELSHQWRSEEQAILVGTKTALLDDPKLTTRKTNGNNPLRIVLDRDLVIPFSFNLLDDSTPTLVFTEKDPSSSLGPAPGKNTEYVRLAPDKKILPQILDVLYKKNIQSLIVEGGTILLNSFLESGIWDEARVFKSGKSIGDGVTAPVITTAPDISMQISGDTLEIFFPSRS